MNTKEAIEFLENYINSAEEGYSISFGYRNISDFRNIVEILRRFEEIEEFVTYTRYQVDNNLTMNDLEQKYFPKE